jgi:hypothetical protein
MRIYRPALISDADALLRLVKSARMKMKGIPSMTFVAEEDGKVVAALGIDWSKDAVVAGPLVLAKEAKGKRFLVLRLVEAMEAWLMQAGVKLYTFGTALSNKRFNAICEHLNLKVYAKKDGRNWYMREVT